MYASSRGEVGPNGGGEVGLSEGRSGAELGISHVCFRLCRAPTVGGTIILHRRQVNL